ncbi:metalloregulator ArsR/SmtB family transcription factor [bacterium]|nr:metalloregulator ArsR/SmtB family transcription factor [bacterium]
MDATFRALANSDRRRILDILKDSPGCSVNHVAEFFEVSRIQILKHLRFLEDANLVVSRKVGRVRHLYFNPVPIQMIYDRWSTEFSSFWASEMTAMKYRIESQRSDNDG